MKLSLRALFLFLFVFGNNSVNSASNPYDISASSETTKQSYTQMLLNFIQKNAWGKDSVIIRRNSKQETIYNVAGKAIQSLMRCVHAKLHKDKLTLASTLQNTEKNGRELWSKYQKFVTDKKRFPKGHEQFVSRKIIINNFHQAFLVLIGRPTESLPATSQAPQKYATNFSQNSQDNERETDCCCSFGCVCFCAAMGIPLVISYFL
ncbi:hypothetical protein K2W90_02425 [Candidatus Babeliales bacterium]|nr:hypothetical protein [Candidatus Babeliales bacterium]